MHNAIKGLLCVNHEHLLKQVFHKAFHDICTELSTEFVDKIKEHLKLKLNISLAQLGYNQDL